MGLTVSASPWGVAMKKFKLDRIISIATLVASLIAIILVLKKPAPVAQPQAPAAIAAHAESFDQKMAQFQQETQQSPSGNSPEPQARSGPDGTSCRNSQSRSTHQF